MRTLKYFVLICSFWISFISCDNRHAKKTDAFREELASREVKKLTNGEIMAAGEKLALQIVDTAQVTLQKALMTALGEQGVFEAIQYCNVHAFDLVKGLEDSLDVTIKRVSDKPRNPNDSLNDFESIVFEAYAYSPDMATSQIQELDEQTLILNKPIKISNGLCLNCHGKVGLEITEENATLIKNLYPNDQATDYAIGDLRGMWSIILPKKTVIKNL